MSSYFDGMAGILNDLTGAPVTITPPAGAPVTLRGLFRDSPVEEPTAMGRPYGVDVFTLQLQKPRHPAVRTDSIVEPSIRPGERFRILGIYSDRSPASDSFEVIELEPVTR